MTKATKLEIETSDLIAKFHTVQEQAGDDLARMIELLLLENYVLSMGQSHGFARGAGWDFSNFPRFLQFSDDQEGEEREVDPAQ